MHIKRLIIALFIGLLVCSKGISQSPSGEVVYADYDVHDVINDSLFKEVIDMNNIDYQRINRVIFYLTNEVRIKYNLPPLSYARQLENSAMMHAQDMIAGGFFSHWNEADATKRTPDDRAKLCNVANPFLAENIIEGYGLQYKSHETVYLRGPGKFSKTTEGELLKPHTYISFGETQIAGWMNSKEHRKNILSKEALQLGCGVAYFVNHQFNDMPSFYLVQNFQWFDPIKPIIP
jgi:uncharacterized protein YkwD